MREGERCSFVEGQKADARQRKRRSQTRSSDYDELDLVFLCSLLLLKAMGIEFNLAIVRVETRERSARDGNEKGERTR